MTHLKFKLGGTMFQAEVQLDPNLELDEILEVQRVTDSGSVQDVPDTADLEPAIERALARRKKELRKGKKTMDTPAAPVLHFPSLVDEPVDEPAPVQNQTGVDNPQVQEVKTMATLTLTFKDIKGSAARFKTGSNVVRIPKALFANGDAPETIELVGEEGQFATRKPQMTKAERKAARASMTPQEKFAEAQKKAAAANARLLKLQAQLAL